MRRFPTIIFILLFSLNSFSQADSAVVLSKADSTRSRLKELKDSLKKVNHHVIGAGVQYMRKWYWDSGHTIYDRHYSFPQWNIFYRYQIVRPDEIHAFNFALSQYYEFVSKTDPSYFSHQTRDYAYNVLSLELGYTYFWWNYKKPRFLIGLSPNIDLRFEMGTKSLVATAVSSSKLDEYKETREAGRFYVMPAGNMEIQYKFPVKSGAAFAIGAKTGFWRRHLVYFAFIFK